MVRLCVRISKTAFKSILCERNAHWTAHACNNRSLRYRHIGIVLPRYWTRLPWVPSTFRGCGRRSKAICRMLVEKCLHVVVAFCRLLQCSTIRRPFGYNFQTMPEWDLVIDLVPKVLWWVSRLHANQPTRSLALTRLEKYKPVVRQGKVTLQCTTNHQQSCLCTTGSGTISVQHKLMFQESSKAIPPFIATGAFENAVHKMRRPIGKLLS